MKRIMVLVVVVLLLPLFLLGCHSSWWQQPSNSTEDNSTQTNSAKQDNSTEKVTKCDRIKQAWETIEPFPYVWGGESKDEGGFDCSGAVYKVQKYIGEPVPRTTAIKMAIMASGERKSWKEGNCGDWIWWSFSPDRPFGHMGMHTEQPYVWQSGSSTGPTRETMFEGSYWDKNFEVTKSPNLE